MPRHSDAIFGITVAAELAGTAAQNLRVYERHGLLAPARTDGGTRRYSRADVDRVVRIRFLLDEGLNLAGVARVLALETEVHALRRRLGSGG
ncbi:MAG: MerR family transcriptional regulator [Marmoricola sp.]